MGKAKIDSVVEGIITFAFIFHLIFFILAGNQDIHESMDEFEFWSDLITDYGVICP